MCEFPQPTNWWRIGITSLVILGALVFAGLWIRAIISQDQKFDSDIWKSQSSLIDESGLRLRMVNDLQQNVLKHGMLRNEIESLLGKKLLVLTTHPDDLTYRLGVDAGSGAISRHGSVMQTRGRVHWLVLKFNERDRLDEWSVVTR